MSETRQLGGVIGAGLIIGLITLIGIVALAPLFDGDLTARTYTAVLSNDGTLSEEYTYDVGSGGEYRMLYRTWEVPLTLTTSTDPFIRFVSMTPASGTTGYIRDNTGTVTIYGPSATDDSVTRIGNLAERNEVGIYNPSYFDAGQYTATYTYIINPPLEYDTTTTHLNLKLAGETHIPYRNVEIRIPASGIDQVYTYPPSMRVETAGDQYLITGSLAANEILAVEMLGPTDAFSQFPGFRSEGYDLSGQTASAAFWYNLPYHVANLVYLLGGIAVILVPLLFYAIYRKYGVEKEFTVPTHLSTLPSTALKPWQVNLLFKGDAMDFDEDGYYATLLDLHRRKNIIIKEKETGKGLLIRVLSSEGTDNYEQRVIAFIGMLSEDGLLDTDRIEALTKKAQTLSSAEETALQYQRSLADVTSRVDTALSTQYIVDGRGHIMTLVLPTIVLLGISIILAIIAPMQSYITFPAVALWVVVLIQEAIAYAAPSTLFGHWKDDRYREKLEWDAFARFLSDMAMIQKYAPADLSMWGEWLVYGTALGEGEKVEAAMKSLNVKIPETGVPMGVVGMNYAFIPLMHFTPPSHGSSGGPPPPEVGDPSHHFELV